MSGEGDELAGLIGRCLDRYLPGIPMDDCLRFMAATAAALRDAGWVAPALSFTEQEADRNARGVCQHEAWEQSGTWCKCTDCGYGWSKRRPRPCCHTTGPNHHPACQESK